MDKKAVIEKVAGEVKERLKNEGSGHDWWHIYRVWQMAKRIAKEEGADEFVVELAALLHDIADWKSHGGDETAGPKIAREILTECKVEPKIIDHVYRIIATSSFKGAGVKFEMETLEGKVVQDADRLDAIGAIGIGRTFTYSGHYNRLMYNPEEKPKFHKTKEEYFKGGATTINHFYEKLLLLKDLMNTKTAKEIAKGRHDFMLEFLKRFYAEWDGKDQ